ncbi:hypothetical protein [Deinococcus yavapaiensis]|uniref:Uncharacterized protein n=1 Tax=Deinococcus yavapaiensis KR-236 TaxID=694435 RepID=A0A318S1U0_9DEIO|nr:hypothetical protein [Deinococcus yavapaiensis]PYE51896.1 hypothetical protein DES52_11497 [Deinococcus yavapaiensis KR-236]
MNRNVDKKVLQNAALIALYEVLRRKAGHGKRKRGLKGRLYSIALRRVERLLKRRGLGGAFKRTWY